MRPRREVAERERPEGDPLQAATGCRPPRTSASPGGCGPRGSSARCCSSGPHAAARRARAGAVTPSSSCTPRRSATQRGVAHRAAADTRAVGPRGPRSAGWVSRFASSPSLVSRISPLLSASRRPTGYSRSPPAGTSCTTVGRPCVSRAVETTPTGLCTREDDLRLGVGERAAVDVDRDRRPARRARGRSRRRRPRSRALRRSAPLRRAARPRRRAPGAWLGASPRRPADQIGRICCNHTERGPGAAGDDARRARRAAISRRARSGPGRPAAPRATSR